jgi:tRNA (guanine-N7-)-methyltransferase
MTDFQTTPPADAGVAAAINAGAPAGDPAGQDYQKLYEEEKQHRARERNLKNIFVILANAGGLADLFTPGEVDGFVTFFPDPWKKKKHAHNRLYSPNFCATVNNHLAPNGFLWLKTDQLPYFTDACALVGDAGFMETPSLPVFKDGDFSSLFLRRFELKGQPWYGRKWLKKSH